MDNSNRQDVECSPIVCVIFCIPSGGWWWLVVVILQYYILGPSWNVILSLYKDTLLGMAHSHIPPGGDWLAPPLFLTTRAGVNGGRMDQKMGQQV